MGQIAFHPMAEDFSLSESDVRAIVRLLGQVIASPDGLREKRRMLMDGLCQMVNATSWAWCMAEFDPDKPPSFIGFEHGGWEEERFARYIEAMNHPDMEKVTRPSSIELKEKGTQLTRTRRQMDPDMLLERTAAAEFWEKADIGAILISQRPMEDGGISGVAVYRRLDLPHFDERESRIAHILLSEIPWLHFSAFPDRASQEITRLYPRHRAVLNLLAEGWSRKKIAASLGITENTVHGYAKKIFKHFGVHSQNELLVRLSKGDGGDTLRHAELPV
ncbi:MAG: LuxR family transcriptional regulator [Verrucomicrobiaceae bacterium]|nr:MAG: LuxR family transcriptional regulator [Verrucomicrobiaceae bacterium]